MKAISFRFVPNNLLLLVFAVVLFLATVSSIFGQDESVAGKNVNPSINKDFINPDLKVDKFIERFEKEGREIYDHRQKILEAVKIKPGTSVADIGAGTGLFTMLFANAVGPEGKVYAVEITKKFTDYIDKRANKAGLKQVQAVLCTERSVELPSNSIDLAFLCDVYHHFEYPQSSMESIYRALKAGGELVLVEFKRIPGETPERLLKHVRAGQEIFTAEIEAVGFKKVEEQKFLKQNYFVRFRKIERK
ncbi:MAG: methyltransferase domain-containing protein [Kiritimatiellae bacterium]|nr:methyltransferase domain-containing protein [Kiritimatiellia bacterium]MDD5521964.1 methyltransferase domain-containing protein [Kiritimatiellia bacterium]